MRFFREVELISPPSLKLRRTEGEMQEWLNWHAWKACVPLEAGPGVRIPLSPQ